MIMTMLGFLVVAPEKGVGESAACTAEADAKNMAAAVSRHRDVVTNRCFIGTLIRRRFLSYPLFACLQNVEEHAETEFVLISLLNLMRSTAHRLAGNADQSTKCPDRRAESSCRLSWC